MKEIVYSNKLKLEVLYQGNYKGYKFVILNRGYYPTAYVENKLGITDIFDERINSVDVHCSFSYCGDAYWDKEDKTSYLGWDYGHICDYNGCLPFTLNKLYTTEEIYEEVKSVIDQLIQLQEKNKKTVFYTDNDGESHEAEIESIDGDYCVISFKGQTLRVSKDELDWEE